MLFWLFKLFTRLKDKKTTTVISGRLPAGNLLINYILKKTP